MEDKLRLNTKLFGFEGVIARRDYCINLVMISAINMFFSLPYLTSAYSKIEKFSDWLNMYQIFLQVPLFIKLWFFIGTVITVILSSSNWFRRLNDIMGEVNLPINILCSVFLVLNCFSFIVFPFSFSLLTGLIAVVIALILIFKKGHVTGKYPYDVTKIFNWGAYLGGWIWGLFNKSYIPLWNFLLYYTPWGFLFNLYCGLKGNEWAFKNKKWQNVEEFNKSQKKQSIIWAVISLVVIPALIYFLVIVIAVFSVAFFAAGDKNATPQQREQRIERLENFVKKTGSIYFESYKITQQENKFYVLSSDWRGYSFSDKKKLLEMAANISAMERNKASKNIPIENRSVYSKASELKRTKIYSMQTGKVLAEIKIDEEELKKVKQNNSIWEETKVIMNSYRFYND